MKGHHRHNSGLSQRRILTLNAHAENLDTASAERDHRAINPQPYAGLGFPSFVFTLVAHKTSRLGIPDPQRSLLPAEQKKNVNLPSCAESRQVAETCSALGRTPISEAALGTNAAPDRAGAHNSRQKHRQLATHQAPWTRRGLRRSSFHLGFQASDLDLLSNPFPGEKLRPNQISSFSRVGNHAVRIASDLQDRRNLHGHRSRPSLRTAQGTNTHWDSQHEPRVGGRPISGWTETPFMGFASPWAQNPSRGRVFTVTLTQGSAQESPFSRDTGGRKRDSSFPPE